MGREVRRELKFVPAQAVIVEHISFTYSCRDCENNSVDVPIVKSKMPKPVIKGSFASPEAIAYIMAQKFVMSSPVSADTRCVERAEVWCPKVAESDVPKLRAPLL